jgi:hypothetical protein
LGSLGLGILAFSLWLLLIPSIGLPQWWRWVLMLGLPLSIYAFLGLLRISDAISGVALKAKNLVKWRMLLETTLLVLLVLPFGVLAGWYISSPQSSPNALFVNQNWNTYLPPTLVGTSIKPQDVQSTVDAVKWLATNSPSGSIVLVEERFMGWALLGLPPDITVIVYPVNASPDSSLSLALSRAGGKSIFMIWLSGHQVTNFSEIQHFGNIAIFQSQLSS